MFLMMTKPVPGWPGYRVSACGQIWSNRLGSWKRLKPRWADSRKYRLAVALYRGSGESREHRTFNVAKVIWIAWCGPVPEGHTVDHEDHDPAHNRLENLRTGDPSQQIMNQRPRGGTSKFKGVCWDEGKGKWRARIKANGRRKSLGYFTSEVLAAITYDHAAHRRDPVFSVLNFPGISEVFA